MGAEDADWGKVEVHSRATAGGAFTALGDPRSWGRVAEQRVIGIESGPRIARTGIIRVQCADGYSRNWQIVGEMIAPEALWQESVLLWSPNLEIYMGVGQTTVRHLLGIRQLIQQAIDSTVYSPINEGGNKSFPFVICGGLIGCAISVALVTANGLQEGTDYLTKCSLLISPYAAGTGL